MVAILIRFVLADWGIGAELMEAKVADFIDSATGLGPFNWVGQEGEKWSFTLQQQGHINQCEVGLYWD